jgi:hypothetical protein
MNERTRFILRHGVVPWGMLAGGIATAVLFATWPPMRHKVRPPSLILAVLAFLCFAEWSLIAGWIVGVVLWTMVPRTHETQRRAGSKSAAGKDSTR